MNIKLLLRSAESFYSLLTLLNVKCFLMHASYSYSLNTGRSGIFAILEAVAFPFGLVSNS